MSKGCQSSTTTTLFSRKRIHLHYQPQSSDLMICKRKIAWFGLGCRWSPIVVVIVLLEFMLMHLEILGALLI